MLEVGGTLRMPPADVEATARLAAQAPAMARALCLVEHSPLDGGLGCASCGAEVQHDGAIAHEADCALDITLTAAGLTPADREAVRTPDTSTKTPGPRSP
jgi:hypothetical protein